MDLHAAWLYRFSACALLLLGFLIPAMAQFAFWGDNSFNQQTPPAGLFSAKQVSCGYGFVVALKADGTVAAWGSPAQHKTQVPRGLRAVVQVAAGKQHALALKKDGTVVAWGGNDFGQATVPTGLTGVIGISAGDKHSVAVKSDGTVVAWGDNSYHQCDVPSTLSGVTQVSAGTGFSVALKSDGTVVCWGDNTFHELEPPAGLNEVTQVSAGKYFALALRKTGTIAAWGTNDKGQCSVPSSFVNVTSISAGDDFGVASIPQGSSYVYGWGAIGADQHAIPFALNGSASFSAGYDFIVGLKKIYLDPRGSDSELIGGSTNRPSIIVSSYNTIANAYIRVSASDPALIDKPFDMPYYGSTIDRTLLLTTKPVPISKFADVRFVLEGAEAQTVRYLMRPMTPKLDLTGSTYEGGSVIHALVGLNAATSEDRIINLSTDHPEWATVPATVTIPKLYSQVLVDIPTTVDPANRTLKISGKFNGYTSQASVTLIKPIDIVSFLTPSEVFGGSSFYVQVTLASNAPAGGSEIILVGDGVPLGRAVVQIPERTTVGDVKIFVPLVSATSEGKIVASHAGTVISNAIAVKPNDITVTQTASTVKGGSGQGIAIKIRPLGQVKDEFIKLASSDVLAVTVPASVPLSYDGFTIVRPKHYRVSKNTEVTITLTFRDKVHTIKLLVTP